MCITGMMLTNYFIGSSFVLTGRGFASADTTLSRGTSEPPPYYSSRTRPTIPVNIRKSHQLAMSQVDRPGPTSFLAIPDLRRKNLKSVTGTVASLLALEDHEYKSVVISALAVMEMRWKNTAYGFG